MAKGTIIPWRYMSKLIALTLGLCILIVIGIYMVAAPEVEYQQEPKSMRVVSSGALSIPHVGSHIHPELLNSGLPQPEGPLLAAPVRKAVNDPGDPFLGAGKVSTKFFDLSETEAQGLFYAKISRVTYTCPEEKIFHIRPIAKLLGSAHELCADQYFTMEPNNCLVYSFGITDEWNFERGVNATYGCELHSFDPRSNFSVISPSEYTNMPHLYYHKIGVWGWNFNTNAGWELRDITTIINLLNHQERTIDVIKLDVEGAEWPILRHIIDSGVHSKIKQMTLEIHAPRVNYNPVTGKSEVVSVLDLSEMWQTLHDVEAVGFRMYMTRTKSCCETYAILKTNPFLAFGDKPKCCFRVVYVNSNFLPDQ